MWSLKENALEIRGALDSGETPGDIDFGDLIITNGSVFYDMNTSKTYMYDESNKSWIEQS